MLWAAGRGVKRIIVGIGGTAMNDGGIGAVQAAGGLVLDDVGSQVESGLVGLSRVARVEFGRIAERFHGIEVIAACDVNNPMTGPDGSTAVYGPQKGLLPSEVIAVDEDMQAYARVLARDLGRDPSTVPGAGAGGSLGGALAAFFGAKLVSGADLIMREMGLLGEMEAADMVITGEGRVDFQTAKGKVPYAVARAAAERSVPTLVIGGGLGDDIIQGYPTEFSAVFSSTLGPMTVEQAMAGAEGSLRYSAEQIGRLARLFAFSYPTGADEASGGVVLRETPGLEVLLILDRYGFAALPKGHLESGETLEEAAAREVFEETGISVAIRQSLGQRKHRYLDPDGNGPVQKTVHYFLMEPIGGALKPQAGETLGAMWISLVDLPDIKTYSGTQLMVERAVKAWEGR